MIGHTPGPWEAKGKSVRTVQHTAEGTAPNGYAGGICNCFGRRMGPRSAIDDVAEANARLIAAAPDLLDAAEALIYRYDNPDRKPYPALRTFGSLMEDLRTAVAKAKG